MDKTRVELFAAIRRDARTGMSNRALQRKHGVGYRTVAAALASAWPEPRKPPSKRASRLDPYRGVIDAWLREDLDAPRKQRRIAKRIFNRLLDEHDAHEVSYGMVREYVATRRREIRIEAGREPATTFIPQEHLPGRQAEVDFGEVVIRLRGELDACALFCRRLLYSGKAIHRISASAGQEAFKERHVHAFRKLGGVPVGKIRYDNARTVVGGNQHLPTDPGPSGARTHRQTASEETHAANVVFRVVRDTRPSGDLRQPRARIAACQCVSVP